MFQLFQSARFGIIRRRVVLPTAVVVLGALDSVSLAADLVELPRDLEVELALSALPEVLQDDATVYVLDPKRGYVLHRTGQNGFVNFVGRTSTRFYESQWPYDYPSDQLIPIAFDSVGAEHHMAPWFDLASMRAEGVTPQDAKRAIRERFRDGTYTVPSKGGLSYMLAPIHRAYSAPEQSDEMITVSFPHYMPYAPHVTSVQLGNDNPMNGGPFALNHGGHDTGPHGYMIFMVPLPQVDEIRTRYAGMLKQLCDLHANWCLAEDE